VGSVPASAKAPPAGVVPVTTPDRRAMVTVTAGSALAGPLGGGQAGAVIAGSPHLTTLVHRAFADGLDVMYLVAAGFAVLGVIVVFALVKPSAAAAPAPQEREAAPTSR